MVEVNPNGLSLQAQLQAQLQAGKTGLKARASSVEQAPRPQEGIEERIKARGDESASRRLPVKQTGRSLQLSSQAELDQAKERVNQVAANSREAPIGRTSIRQNELRNQPLGQIIDIRV